MARSSMRRLLYVARHGETDWNVAGRWQGHTDVPLNERGRMQARVIAGTLRGAGIGGVVASDLQRAHETASIAAMELGIAMGYVDEDLRERSFGPFEGLTREECERLHAEAWRAWREDRRAPGGAETQEVLALRVSAAIGRAADRVARDDAPALVVTHGGALRALVATLTGELPPLVHNGAIWKITWEDRIVAAEQLP